MRLGLIMALAACLAETAGAAELSGRYAVEGRNADGSAYAGTAEISDGDDGCTLVWRIGDEATTARCEAGEDGLSATYTMNGAAGRADYALAPDGSLSGIWRLEGRDGEGSEVLRPQAVVEPLEVVMPLEDAATFVRDLYRRDPIYNPIADEPFDAWLAGPALAAVTKSVADADGEAGCIDFVLTVNAQDWDDATVRDTLTVEPSAGSGMDHARVTAEFAPFAFDGIAQGEGERVAIDYSLRSGPGGWRITDMAARAAGTAEELWRLSTLCP